MSDPDQNLGNNRDKGAVSKKQVPVLIFRLLIGVFLFSRGIYISGFIGSAPGRERYFLALFGVIFLVLSVHMIVMAAQKLKHGISNT